MKQTNMPKGDVLADDRRQNRREFIRNLLGCAAGVTLGWLLPQALRAATETPPTLTGKPNILYIMTDQQWNEAMSCAGNPHLKTPAMDSIAANGMRFTEAYCNNPVCLPSRVSMVTGQYPSRFGIIGNGGNQGFPKKSQRSPDKASFIDNLLAPQGYDCAYAGKWHAVGDGYGGMSAETAKDHAFRVLSSLPDKNVSKTCSEFLLEKRDKPFFLFASFIEPHGICFSRPSKGSFQAEGGGSKPMPFPPVDQCPPLPTNFDPTENECFAWRKSHFYTKDAMKEVAPFTSDDFRQYLYSYYRLIEMADQHIGIVLDALRKSGQEENTLVIFSSDHGNGTSHRWHNKCVHYEEVVRVPFIISRKGSSFAGKVDRETLVSTGIDFYATALEYGGCAQPKECMGKSLRPVLEGKNGKHREYVISEIGAIKQGMGRMLRTPQYKYTIYNRGDHREQLYDMVKDRGEMKNLAADPARRNVLNEHRKLLQQWCKEIEDDQFESFLVAPEAN